MKTKPFLPSKLRHLILTLSVAALPLAVCAQTESPSELLEKGVYAEDTKGDLDAAIAIYQQLAAETSASQAIAAQGQYRLAECYLKKNQTADAKAAFEKLIHDYPDQKELIAKAHAELPGTSTLLPIPWTDGERLQLNITMGDGLNLGMVEYRSDLIQNGGTNVWRVGARMAAGQAESLSSVDVDPETFNPISSHWKHSMLGDASAVYHSDRVEIQNEGKSARTVTLNDTVYDNEESINLIRRLPLKEGYKTSLTIFSSLGGNCIPISLEVTGREPIETPAGSFNCFKVQLSVGQTFWISTDENRYLVKFETGSATAVLNQVSHHRPDEIAAYSGPLGITFAIPPGWVLYGVTNGQPDGQMIIRTFDPKAAATDAGLRLFPTSSLSDDSKSSARAWADHDFKNYQVKMFKNMTLRPGSQQDYRVGTRTGSSYLADFTIQGKPQTLFALYVLGTDYSERFVLICPPDKFDGIKADFDAIIASYHKP